MLELIKATRGTTATSCWVLQRAAAAAATVAVIFMPIAGKNMRMEMCVCGSKKCLATDFKGLLL